MPVSLGQMRKIVTMFLPTVRTYPMIAIKLPLKRLAPCGLLLTTAHQLPGVLNLALASNRKYLLRDQTARLSS